MASGQLQPRPTPPHSSIPTFHHPPLTFQPSGPAHTHTFIFLHGRGDHAKVFGPGFCAAQSSQRDGSAPLPQLYPGLKFVFPTPNECFSHTFQRQMTQWFDFFAGTSPPAYTDHQLESLRAAVEHVLEVIDYEIDVVGIPSDRILLGGLSQGCATALFALLMGKRKLGGFVGMSGWMPFAETIRNMLVGVGMPMRPGPPPVVTRMPPGVDVGMSPPDFEDPPWEEAEELKLRERAQVVASLREKVMKSVDEMNEDTFKQILETKMWLGHGDADTVVTYETGRKVYAALKALGMDVTWKRYECWIHWYKVPEEIDDIVRFFADQCHYAPQ